MVRGTKSGSVIFEGIFMMLESKSPGNRAKKELLRIETLTSGFPHSDLEPDFLRPKFQIKVYKHYKTVHCAYAYHYILLIYSSISQMK
jgi:hypothetical protein